MSMEHDLFKNIRDINACIDFEIIEVKVPIIFSCVVGFLHREGRYIFSLSASLLPKVTSSHAIRWHLA